MAINKQELIDYWSVDFDIFGDDIMKIIDVSPGGK
jgi:hypothetical protein